MYLNNDKNGTIYMMKSGSLFSRRNRILLYELVKTDFKLRYQGSFLGVIWSVLKPLMLFTIMYVVFVYFLRIKDGTATYPIVLLLGISLWNFFTESTSVSMQAVVGRGDMIRKINFPKYIIVLSSMTSAMISLIINLGVVIIFMLFMRVELTLNLLWLPLNFLQLFMLAFGVSLFLSALYVKFRDIGHIYEVLLQILFYSMPIIYPLSYIYGRKIFGIPFESIIMLNPLAQTIQDIRHNLVAPETTPVLWGVVNNPIIVTIPIILTIIILLIGVRYFNRNSRKFAETV